MAVSSTNCGYGTKVDFIYQKTGAMLTNADELFIK